MNITYTITLSEKEKEILLKYLDITRDAFLEEKALCKEESSSYTLEEYEKIAELVQRLYDLL